MGERRSVGRLGRLQGGGLNPDKFIKSRNYIMNITSDAAPRRRPDSPCLLGLGSLVAQQRVARGFEIDSSALPCLVCRPTSVSGGGRRNSLRFRVNGLAF